jgi:hypothetical protein
MTCAFPADETRPRQLIAVLGAPRAGKTVYLGMLADILSRSDQAFQIFARGAHSVSLQQEVMAALARHRFPSAQNGRGQGWNWLHCEVRGQRQRNTDLILPDVAGASLNAELHDPASVPIMRPFLEKCAATLLIVDGERVEQGDHEQEFFARKLINHLCDLAPSRKTGWRGRPVAIVFAKADRSPACQADATRYAENYTPGLWRQCRDQLKQFRFFAASAVGRCTELRGTKGPVRVPLRVEPRGVVEPFQWLVTQMA